jgi:hypothetical protein
MHPGVRVIEMLPGSACLTKLRCLWLTSAGNYTDSIPFVAADSELPCIRGLMIRTSSIGARPRDGEQSRAVRIAEQVRVGGLDDVNTCSKQ